MLQKDRPTIQASQPCSEPTEPTTSQTNNTQVVDYHFVQPPPPILNSNFGVPHISNSNNLPGIPLAPFKNIIWNIPPPNYPAYPVINVPVMPPQNNGVDKNDILVQNTAVSLSQRFKEIKEQTKEPFIIHSQSEKNMGTYFVPVTLKPLLQHDLRMKLTAKRRMHKFPISNEAYNKGNNLIISLLCISIFYVMFGFANE